MCSSNCRFLAYRFLRKQVRRYHNLISLRIFHSLLWSTQSEALVWSMTKNRCFSGTLFLFRWSNSVGNLMSGSSAFSKSSLYIWNFSVHILLKPCLKDFEHYLASMWNECNCVVVWTFFGIAFLWDWMKTDIFQSCGHCCVSKFAGILSAALSQHHLSGFEIAQLEFHHLH